MKNWSVIGCGNMAQALCRGVAPVGDEVKFHYYNPTASKAQMLSQELGGIAWNELSQVPLDGVVMLGFKPQQLATVAPQLRTRLSPNAIVVSMLAAVSTELLAQFLGTKRLVRIMPNLPVASHLGATTFFSLLDDQTLGNVLMLLNRTGLMLRLDKEEMIDLATPYHGSAPALYYWLLEKMMTDLECQGMNSSQARALTVASLQGAAYAASHAQTDFASMRMQVTSKGGLTAEMIAELEEAKVADILSRAMARAQARGRELSSQLLQQIKK